MLTAHVHQIATTIMLTKLTMLTIVRVMVHLHHDSMKVENYGIPYASWLILS